MSLDRSSLTARKGPRVKEVTRFVIRVTGSRPWRWNPSYEAMLLIERTLKKLLADRKLELDLFASPHAGAVHYGDRPF
jgi:hypothetical protein